MRLPFDAEVSSASINVSTAANSTFLEGSVRFDVGDDGSIDGFGDLRLGSHLANASISPAAIHAALRSQNATSGDLNVTIAVTSCPLGLPWYLTFDNISVLYTFGATVNHVPTFTGPAPTLEVTAGEANLSAVDLAAYFSDADNESLNYSAEVLDAQQSPDSELAGAADLVGHGVTLAINGSRLYVSSSNASWWGYAFISVRATDANGLSTPSEFLYLGILPSAAELNQSRTEHVTIGATMLASSCGPVSRVETVNVPFDAVIIRAYADVGSDATNYTASGATVNISVGGTLYASNATRPDERHSPGWVPLDATALTAYMQTRASSNGFIGLDFAFSVCPSPGGGVAAVYLGGLQVTWVRGTTSGSASTLPNITALSVNGGASSTIESGSAFTLEAVGNGTFGAATEFSWFVDGSFVARGRVLSNLTLSSGEHTIEVRASEGMQFRTYTAQITVAARVLPPPVGFPFALIAVGMSVAAVGVVVGRTETGRWYLFAILFGSVFTRLKRASLLDHFVRGQLYQVIRENPGIHFAELRRRTGTANGVASHHLRVLEQGGYLRVVIDRTRTRFYATDRPLEEEVYGISDTERAILDVVTQTPGIGQGELAVQVQRSVSVVSRSVTRLASLGYVTTDHEHGRIHVFPRPGVELMAKLLPTWPDEGA